MVFETVTRKINLTTVNKAVQNMIKLKIESKKTQNNLMMMMMMMILTSALFQPPQNEPELGLATVRATEEVGFAAGIGLVSHPS